MVGAVSRQLQSLQVLQNLRMRFTRRDTALGDQPLSALADAPVTDVPHRRVSPQVISVVQFGSCRIASAISATRGLETG